MNWKKNIVAFLLASLLITSCGWDVGSNDNQTFAQELRGTWVSNDPAIYSGTLIIGSERITIIGYGEDQLPPRGGNDNNRPFKGFTKGTALKGYSEEGKIFINDGGMVQEGIPYIYWEDEFPPDYQKVKFLRFTFGDRVETLEYSMNVW
jgi:hypothetical protein